MKKKFDLAGKTAIITGGGSGIGRSIAMALAENGAHTIILDLNLEGANSVVKDIRASCGQAQALKCDVSNHEEVSNAFQEGLKGKPLDILVNNAGIGQVGNILNTSIEDFDLIYQVNIKGVFNCLKAGVEALKTNGGTIVNLSSVAAHVGVADRFAYSASKGAVHAMTLSVAKDCLDYDIRCNSISPGRVHTQFVDDFLEENYPGNEKTMFNKLSETQPIGRMGRPDEIADLVLYLCADEAAFITGSNFSIDGGFVTLNT